MDQAFIDSIDAMNFAQLKDAYRTATVEDDEMGATVIRADHEKQDIIFRRVAQLIAEDSDYDPESGERDFNSAAKDFLESD
jgi:hypothetical protein